MIIAIFFFKDLENNLEKHFIDFHNGTTESL